MLHFELETAKSKKQVCVLFAAYVYIFIVASQLSYKLKAVVLIELRLDYREYVIPPQ